MIQNKKLSHLFYRKVEGFGISIFVLDRSKKVSRSLQSEVQSYSGAEIGLVDTNVSRVKKYVLTFEQWHYTPDVRSCVDYPSKKYQSYEECDKEFVKQRTKDVGVIPFWATDNLKEVTKLSNSSKLSSSNIELWELFDGSLESTCRFVFSYALNKGNIYF